MRFLCSHGGLRATVANNHLIQSVLCVGQGIHPRLQAVNPLQYHHVLAILHIGIGKAISVRQTLKLDNTLQVCQLPDLILPATGQRGGENLELDLLISIAPRTVFQLPGQVKGPVVILKLEFRPSLLIGCIKLGAHFSGVIENPGVSSNTGCNPDRAAISCAGSEPHRFDMVEKFLFNRDNAVGDVNFRVDYTSVNVDSIGV